jgi:predicted PurR-regulated permease PerM
MSTKGRQPAKIQPDSVSERRTASLNDKEPQPRIRRSDLVAIALVVGLMSAPLLEWTSRLPELATILRSKMEILSRPLAALREFQAYFSNTSDVTPFELPKIEWVAPTLSFITPTFAELLLFLATLVLFISGWADLRKALVLLFPNHDIRLLTLRVLNEIEQSLGGYLIMVSGINIGVGVAAGLICMVTGMPNPAGLGALAATLNFIPIIGPVVMFIVLLAVGLISFPTMAAGLLAPALFAAMTFVEGHFITPVIIGRRLALNTLAVFLALAFWTWLWGPIGAFLSAPLLIVGLVLKEHLLPTSSSKLIER